MSAKMVLLQRAMEHSGNTADSARGLCEACKKEWHWSFIENNVWEYTTIYF